MTSKTFAQETHFAHCENKTILEGVELMHDFIMEHATSDATYGSALYFKQEARQLLIQLGYKGEQYETNKD